MRTLHTSMRKHRLQTYRRHTNMQSKQAEPLLTNQHPSPRSKETTWPTPLSIGKTLFCWTAN